MARPTPKKYNHGSTEVPDLGRVTWTSEGTVLADGTVRFWMLKDARFADGRPVIKDADLESVRQATGLV